MNVPAPKLATQAEYLAARRPLLQAREGFFDVIRSYLRPEQRPDAARLGDLLASSTARTITEEDWLTNPVRGYLVVMEAQERGRPFRLCVLQQGYELRVGVQSTAKTLGLNQRISLTRPYAGITPLLSSRGFSSLGECVMLDWHFNVPDLYQSATAFEDAVFKVGSIYEAALQVLAPTAVS
jgi:hypothetical protein